MTEKNHLHPLAPRTYPGSEDPESAKITIPKRAEGSSKILVHFLATLVVLFAILLALASIFLRVRTPHVQITSIIVKNLGQSTHNASSSPWQNLNATLVTVLSIKNANFGRFEFGDSSASFFHGNLTVGSAKIGGGHAKARATRTMNLTVDVWANNSLSNLRSSDAGSGLLELRGYANLSGEVDLVNVVKRRRTTEMNCSLTLNFTTHAIRDLYCNR